jgi:hypothetical protein
MQMYNGLNFLHSLENDFEIKTSPVFENMNYKIFSSTISGWKLKHCPVLLLFSIITQDVPLFRELSLKTHIPFLNQHTRSSVVKTNLLIPHSRIWRGFITEFTMTILCFLGRAPPPTCFWRVQSYVLVINFYSFMATTFCLQNPRAMHALWSDWCLSQTCKLNLLHKA